MTVPSSRVDSGSDGATLGIIWTAPAGVFGGYERFVLDVTSWLPRFGIGVRVLRPTPSLAKLIFRLTGEVPPSRSVGAVPLPAAGISSSRNRLSAIYIKSDVLDLALARMRWTRVPWIVGFHSATGASAIKERAGLRRLLYSRTIYGRLLLARCSCAHVLTPGAAQLAAERYRLPNVRLMSSYVRASIDPGDRQQRVSNTLEGSGRSPRFLYIGRLSYEKGFDLLLEATKQLRREGVTIELTVAGNGPLVEAVRERKDIEYLGFVDDPSDLMRRSHYLVVPSRWEEAPFVAREAAALGLPTLLSDIDGLESHVIRPEMCFQSGSTASLMGVLRKAIEIYRSSDYAEVCAATESLGAGEKQVGDAMAELAIMVREIGRLAT